MATWHTAESATTAWGDAAGVPELAELLEVCADACWGFVPEDVRQAIVGANVDPDVRPADVPARFRLAQLRQAQNVARTVPGTDGNLGLDGYAPKAYVFGYDVRTILLPPTAGPGFY